MPIRANESFLLAPAPAFDAPLRGNAVGDPIEIFGPHKRHGPPREGVSRIATGVMLINARREIVSSRAADVIGAIRATEHIHV